MGEDEDPDCAHFAHEIVLDAYALQYLGGPVWLRHPGLPLREAAALLGRRPATVTDWLPVKVGKTVPEKQAVAEGLGLGQRRWASYEDPETGWGVRYEPCRAAGRKAGMEVPVVWCDKPIDPAGPKGRPPSAYWGRLWMSLADRIPDHFEQPIVRVPRFQTVRGRRRFRGWLWRCPGLVQGAGARQSPSPGPSLGGGGLIDAVQSSIPDPHTSGCGRLALMLYAPLPVWTIARAYGIEEGLGVEGLAGEWFPGVMDRWQGRRQLACDKCWGV